MGRPDWAHFWPVAGAVLFAMLTQLEVAGEVDDFADEDSLAGEGLAIDAGGDAGLGPAFGLFAPSCPWLSCRSGHRPGHLRLQIGVLPWPTRTALRAKVAMLATIHFFISILLIRFYPRTLAAGIFSTKSSISARLSAPMVKTSTQSRPSAN
jgi:hypothetical protein